jgi:hypothetical protein
MVDQPQPHAPGAPLVPGALQPQPHAPGAPLANAPGVVVPGAVVHPAEPVKAAPKKVPPPLTDEQKADDFRYTLDQIRSKPYDGHLVADAIAFLAGDKAKEPEHPKEEVAKPEFVLDHRGYRHNVAGAHELRDEYGRVLRSKTLPVDRHADWKSAEAVPGAHDRGEAPVDGKPWVLTAKPSSETKPAAPASAAPAKP